jgi:hypothetical protein
MDASHDLLCFDLTAIVKGYKVGNTNGGKGIGDERHLRIRRNLSTGEFHLTIFRPAPYTSALFLINVGPIHRNYIFFVEDWGIYMYYRRYEGWNGNFLTHELQQSHVK